MITKKYSLTKMLKEIGEDESMEGSANKEDLVSQDDIAKLIQLRKRGGKENDQKS